MDTAGQTPTGQHTAGLMDSTREVKEEELTRRGSPPSMLTPHLKDLPLYPLHRNLPTSLGAMGLPRHYHPRIPLVGFYSTTTDSNPW
eukprot:3673420-Rhodomonas_salina.1